MNAATVISGILNKTVAWFRAGYSQDGPQYGHVALVALVPAARGAVHGH